MTNNQQEIQRQIKAFNRAFSRAEKAGKVSNKAYERITDLIDYERMTQKGFAKAGTRYLEAMSDKELLAYSSDIEEARDVLDLESFAYRLEIQDAKDPKSLLWKYQDYLISKGMPYDSDQIYAYTSGATKKVTWQGLIKQMQKYLHDKNYGLSDALEWFEAQEGLSE